MSRLGYEKAISYMDAKPLMATHVIGESMTRQDQAEAVNINTIYKKTQQGQLVMSSGNMPQFGDFSDNGTYDQMLEVISEAHDAFMELPADVREAFNHDPAKYYEHTLQEAQDKIDKKAAKELKAKQELEHAERLEEARKLVKDNPEES